MKKNLRRIIFGLLVATAGMFFPVSTLAYTDITANITQNTTWTTAGIYTQTPTTVDSSNIYNNSTGVSISTINNDSANNVNVRSSNIYNNTFGVYVQSGGGGNISSNSIYGNTSYGVNDITNLSSSLRTYATYNYWGAANGPKCNVSASSTEPCLTGSGNKISDNFTNPNIVYLPFATTTPPHYILTNALGNPSNSVDISGGVNEIRWDWGASAITSTSTLSTWYSSIGTWNALGKVNIATDTALTIQDLTVSSTTRADVGWGGQWQDKCLVSNCGNADTLDLNSYFLELPQYQVFKKNIITHELGHALGLAHSYSPNMMNYLASTTTALGAQDISDYNYCWTSPALNCKNPQ